MKVFDENPNLDEVYQTADENLFFLRNAAENHAKTLADKRVKRIVRSDAKGVAVIDVDAPNVIGLDTFQTGADENGNPNLKQAVMVVDESGNGTLDSVDVPAPKTKADLTNLMPQNVNSAVKEQRTKNQEPKTTTKTTKTASK